MDGVSADVCHPENERYRLVEDGHLIKRRTIDGEWQRTVEIDPEVGHRGEVDVVSRPRHDVERQVPATVGAELDPVVIRGFT